jgi:hypothetical protein
MPVLLPWSGYSLLDRQTGEAPPMTQPSLGDWFPLDADTIRTAYIKSKAARLLNETWVTGPGIGHRRVIYRDHLSTATTKRYSVWGDSGRIYTVWLRTDTTPWTAACSRGGIHDHQAEGEACSHGLAAAVAWELQREAVPT